MKILIANRGEIAIRIMRTCRELKIPSVAVYSDADRNALHTRYADEALAIGSTSASDSYLNFQAILNAAKQSGATAIHPGYGFLSENSGFARAVETAGLRFIGPRPKTMAILGDKVSARKRAREAELPVLPGPDQPLSGNVSLDEISAAGKEIRFPILVKAAAGGGGKGIRLARTHHELREAVQYAQQEAQAAFGDPTVYLEPLVQQARHIEVQILGDGNGKVLCFGERECSIQRRHQKLIEEAPAPKLSNSQRTFVHEAALKLGKSLHYRSLGTVEFLLDKEGQFHFIEVNPRIQVEHPVTEMITGFDLVKEQIKLVLTGELSIRQDEIAMKGAAIEARVLAEDPDADFMPTTGEVLYLKEPGGPGIRVDSSLYQGMETSVKYDSLLAKLIAWGQSREEALSRLRRALREYQIGGLKTDLAFLSRVIDAPLYRAGKIDTSFLDEVKLSQNRYEETLTRNVALATVLHAHRRQRGSPRKSNQHDNPWRRQAWREQMT